MFCRAWPLTSSIIAWLEQKKFDDDVLTDEDLHREGALH